MFIKRLNNKVILCYSLFFKHKDQTMDNITPICKKITSLTPTYVVDYATFIGSGILASSSSTLWINDPTTKSGIALAGFFNATALGVVNYFLKTDENSSLGLKIILTIGTLAITSFAIPYLAIALKDRFAIVLTSHVALQVGGLNLAAKAITYMLYILGSRSTSLKQLTTPEEINLLSPEQIKTYFNFFNNKENQIAWSSNSRDVKDAFTLAFLKHPEIQQMILPRDPDVIGRFTKLEAIVLHEHLLSAELVPPPSLQITESYVQLFFKHDLLPLNAYSRNVNNQILPKNLPIPNDPNYFVGLTYPKMEWYELFLKDKNNWRLFTLELHHAYNIKGLEYNMPKKHLTPPDTLSIQNAHEDIILDLDSQIRNPIWGEPPLENFTKEMQDCLKNRIYSIRDAYIEKITRFSVEQFTPEEIKNLWYLYTIRFHIEMGLPSVPIQKALSKKFIALRLKPPYEYWECEYKLPVTPEGFKALKPFEWYWVRSHFSTYEGSREQLSPECLDAFRRYWSD